MAQHTCIECGVAFARPGKRPYSFCSVFCRARASARAKANAVDPSRRCPICGAIRHCATKTGPCRKCSPVWTPERDAYLLAHYAEDGAPSVAEHLGLTVSSVRSRACQIGDWGYSTAYQKRRASKNLTESNPMHNPETAKKVRDYYEAHPEAKRDRHQRILTGLAAHNLANPSGLEARLYAALDALGVEYRAQVIVADRFVADVVCGSVVIELDGDYWHGHPRFEPLTDRQTAQKAKDAAKDAALAALGYTVARVWESEFDEARVAQIVHDYQLVPGA